MPLKPGRLSTNKNFNSKRGDGGENDDFLVKCTLKPKAYGVFSGIITDTTNTECKKGKKNHPHPSQCLTSEYFKVGVFPIL